MGILIRKGLMLCHWWRLWWTTNKRNWSEVERNE